MLRAVHHWLLCSVAVVAGFMPGLWTCLATCPLQAEQGRHCCCPTGRTCGDHLSPPAPTTGNLAPVGCNGTACELTNVAPNATTAVLPDSGPDGSQLHAPAWLPGAAAAAPVPEWGSRVWPRILGSPRLKPPSVSLPLRI